MTFGLALSGGGLKGVAHLGVLEVLLENDLAPDAIAGSSAGGIIAVGYAVGLSPKEMLELLIKTKPDELFDLPVWVFILWYIHQRFINKVTAKTTGFVPSGLLSGNKLEKWFANNLGNVNFKQISYPIAITSTDINKEELVLFHSDGFSQLGKHQELKKVVPGTAIYQDISLNVALRATSSIPGVFAPKIWSGRTLVDGGLLNNMPANILKAAGINKVIAVNLSSQKRKDPVSNVVDVSIQAIDLMVKNTTQILAEKYADIILTPQTGRVSLLDLHKAEETYKAGRESAQEALPQIKDLLDT